jgi:hypothetical protein
MREVTHRASSNNKSSPVRESSSFSNRIRAYKTPLMF